MITTVFFSRWQILILLEVEVLVFVDIVSVIIVYSNLIIFPMKTTKKKIYKTNNSNQCIMNVTLIKKTK